MTRILLLFFATTILLTVSCQQNNKVLSDLDIELLNSTRASLKQAMLDGDIETIKQIYSDDYGLVTRRGIFQTRTERLEMLESGRLQYLDVGIESEVTVNVYGNIAVVIGVVGAAVTKFDGERRESSARRFTEVWVHENGEWREVIRQTTVIDKPVT
jgi:ketosteroid isomerase-like protein